MEQEGKILIARNAADIKAALVKNAPPSLVDQSRTLFIQQQQAEPLTAKRASEELRKALGVTAD